MRIYQGPKKMTRRINSIIAIAIAIIALPSSVYAEEQDAETKALDSTASQWSFQLAYQATPDYFTDILNSGQPRPEGTTDYLQLRVLMPLVF
jgi:hypothetical protein